MTPAVGGVEVLYDVTLISPSFSCSWRKVTYFTLPNGVQHCHMETPDIWKLSHSSMMAQVGRVSPV